MFGGVEGVFRAAAGDGEEMMVAQHAVMVVIAVRVVERFISGGSFCGWRN